MIALRASAEAKTLGSRIRVLRRARGWTQDALAASTGVSRSAVAQWETDRAGQLSDHLERIAEVLGVTVQTLKHGWSQREIENAVSNDELALLQFYRNCKPQDRACLMHVAEKLSSVLEG